MIFVRLLSVLAFFGFATYCAHAAPPQRDVDQNPIIAARAAKPIKKYIPPNEDISEFERGSNQTKKTKILGLKNELTDIGLRAHFIVPSIFLEKDKDLILLIRNSSLSFQIKQNHFDNLFVMKPSELENLKDELLELELLNLETALNQGQRYEKNRDTLESIIIVPGKTKSKTKSQVSLNAKGEVVGSNGQILGSIDTKSGKIVGKNGEVLGRVRGR